MNWDAIGACAEVVGAIGVVVSLVYLAIQVRSNTSALKAGASFETTHSWATFNEMVVSSMIRDPELGERRSRVTSGTGLVGAKSSGLRFQYRVRYGPFQFGGLEP